MQEQGRGRRFASALKEHRGRLRGSNGICALSAGDLSGVRPPAGSTSWWSRSTSGEGSAVASIAMAPPLNRRTFVAAGAVGRHRGRRLLQQQPVDEERRVRPRRRRAPRPSLRRPRTCLMTRQPALSAPCKVALSPCRPRPDRHVAIPATIPANCSQDVSGPLKKWLNRLPANSTVLVSAQACYRVDKGLRLKNPTGLTIYGGTFTSDATTPGKKKTAKEQYVFDLVGGSNVTLESMKINGQNPGGYHANMAFAGAIDVEGTSGITIMGVTITNPFGDGISLSPLRGGADNDSGTIVGPTKNAVIQGVSISGAGRQAVTMASASGVQVSDLVVLDPGINTFDIEADQHNEGADNVTIDGCTTSGGQIFFANGGSGSSDNTHDFTIAHCAMARTTAGDAILSIAHGPSQEAPTRSVQLRGRRPLLRQQRIRRLRPALGCQGDCRGLRAALPAVSASRARLSRGQECGRGVHQRPRPRVRDRRPCRAHCDGQGHGRPLGAGVGCRHRHGRG